MLEVGSVIDGKYKILNKIGEGGTSIVYLAINERVNKSWAIKEIRRDDTKYHEMISQGLCAEIEILKMLSHRHLPSIVDIIDRDDSFLIVMDYIEGWTLERELEEYGPKSQEQVITWALQLCDVLGYLHSRNPAIIYRDMKPSNIMKKPDGTLVLIDFGTARRFRGNSYQDTVCLGTIGYAAPEQFGGRGETDARTDIYCLGATLYHLITGHNPNDAPYKMYPIRFWNPELSSGLEYILQKCTRRDPQDRYQSCTVMMYELEHYHDVDSEQRKKMRWRFSVFMVMAFLTVFCGLISLGFYGAYCKAKESTYDYYVKCGDLSQSLSEKEMYYRMAIDLDSSQTEAYVQLLTEVYLADGEYEYVVGTDYGLSYQTEAQKMDTLLFEFSGNVYDYAEIVYRVGVAVYYYADGMGNKQGASKYFADMINSVGKRNFGRSDGTWTQKLTRASCLLNIAEYYTNLYTVDRAGDYIASFEDYWEDMKQVIQGNIVETDNYKTALVVYKEFVTAVRDQIFYFKQSGVEKDDLELQLNVVEQHLTEDFSALISNESTITMIVQEEIREELSKTEDILNHALQQIALAYGES